MDLHKLRKMSVIFTVFYITIFYLIAVFHKNQKKILYTPEINQIALQKFELEKKLRQAIKENEFSLYYQPQIDTKTNKIIGAEALIRWNHPGLGLISPNEFISLAEETGLIVQIGEWVLRTACSQMKLWRDNGHDLSKIGVNISVKQFQLTK